MLFLFKIGRELYKGSGNIQLKAVKEAGFKVVKDASSDMLAKAKAFSKIPDKALLKMFGTLPRTNKQFKPARFGKNLGTNIPAAKFETVLVRTGSGPAKLVSTGKILEVAGKKIDTKKISPAQLEKKLANLEKKKVVSKKKVEDKKKPVEKKKVEDKKKKPTTTEKKKPTTTRGGSGNQTNKKKTPVVDKKKPVEKKKPTNTRGGSKVKQRTAVDIIKDAKTKNLKPNKPSKPLTANQTDRLVNQISNKTNMAKGPIRSFISKNAAKLGLASIPLVGMAAVVIGELMSSSKIAKSTLRDGPIITNTKFGQRNRTKKKSSNTKVSSPQTNFVKKSKTRPEALKKIKATVQKVASSKKFNLIGGGTGTATQRLAEIDAEKKLEKRLKRRPTKTELKKYLKNN